MKNISTKMTPRLLEEINKIIEDGWYSSRSEFIRDAVRQKIQELRSEKFNQAIKDDVQWGLYGKE